MKIGKTHTKFLLQLVFSVVVIIISIKPIIELSNLLADNSDSIEMFEDIDGEEEDTFKELDEYIINSDFILSTLYVDLLDKRICRSSNQQIIQMISEVPSPPPKFTII